MTSLVASTAHVVALVEVEVEVEALVVVPAGGADRPHQRLGWAGVGARGAPLPQNMIEPVPGRRRPRICP